MEKRTSFATKTDKGVFLFTIGEGRDASFLEKTASSEYHPEIAKYIADAKPIPGRTQVLLTALGAGEFWGENKNGDFFIEEGLKNPTIEFGYKTFEQFARVYRHHVNKSHSPHFGQVALSVWNETMKRVELIIMLDHSTASDLVDRVNNGEYPSVSMGTKVPFDVCSICGNKASQRKFYCDHLRYYMRKVPPGHSKKAVAINTRPKFFDISFVFVGADSIARVLKKVASHESPAEKVAARKHATINKRVESNIEPEIIEKLDDGVEVLRAHEPEFDNKTIKRIAGCGPPGIDTVNRILSTLTYMGIDPKPAEFQSIVLRALGKNRLADEYESSGITFNPDTPLSKERLCQCDKMLDIRPGNFDDNVFDSAAPYVDKKSYATPIMHKRIILITKLANDGKLRYPLEKHASAEESSKISLLPMMAILAGLQMALSKKVPTSQLAGIDKVLADKSKLGLILAGTVGVAAGMKHLFSPTPIGNHDVFPGRPVIQAPDPSNWRGEIAGRAANPLHKIAGLKTLVFGVPSIYALSGIQEAKRARDPYGKEGRTMKFIRKHPDIASVGLVAGPSLFKKMTGSSISSLAKRAVRSPSLKRFLLKKGSYGADMGYTALAAAAFPSASVAGRAVGWGIDQTVLSGLGALAKLKKKKTKQRRAYADS